MPNLLMEYGDRLKPRVITSLVYTDDGMKDEGNKKVTAQVRKEEKK